MSTIVSSMRHVRGFDVARPLSIGMLMFMMLPLVFLPLASIFIFGTSNGLDKFFDNEKDGRDGIVTSLNYLTSINQENPNSMIIQVFFQGKSGELIKVFSKADGDTKKKAKEMLMKLDITNANAYKEL